MEAHNTKKDIMDITRTKPRSVWGLKKGHNPSLIGEVMSFCPVSFFTDQENIKKDITKPPQNPHPV